MTAEFQASERISPELCSELSALEPRNPFCTWAYASAMHALGARPWLLCWKDGDRLVAGCLGFLRIGRLNRSLEIASLPCLAPDMFWTELIKFCHRTRVNQLSVGSFASPRAEIPSLPGETGRRPRVEYVLALQEPTLWSAVSSNHRRNIQKAQKAGVCIERSSTRESCREHALLQDASMERRMSRGEHVTVDAQIRTPLALVQHGSGEFFRAMRAGQVLSSILILRAPLGAYYHSAGTSRDGMANGASHLLIREVAETLRGEGIEQFNLGGADPGNPGLERFKVGFGARPVLLEAAQFSFSGRLQKSLDVVANLIRRFVHTWGTQQQDSPEATKQQSAPS